MGKFLLSYLQTHFCMCKKEEQLSHTIDNCTANLTVSLFLLFDSTCTCSSSSNLNRTSSLCQIRSEIHKKGFLKQIVKVHLTQLKKILFNTIV